MHSSAVQPRRSDSRSFASPCPDQSSADAKLPHPGLAPSADSSIDRGVLYGRLVDFWAPPITGKTARTQQEAAAFSQRSEEHTSELQSLMRISYAVFCLTQKRKTN